MAAAAIFNEKGCSRGGQINMLQAAERRRESTRGTLSPSLKEVDTLCPLQQAAERRREPARETLAPSLREVAAHCSLQQVVQRRREPARETLAHHLRDVAAFRPPTSS